MRKMVRFFPGAHSRLSPATAGAGIKAHKERERFARSAKKILIFDAQPLCQTHLCTFGGMAPRPSPDVLEAWAMCYLFPLTPSPPLDS